MTTISAKIDNSDKNRFESICDSMGLNISSTLSAFVKPTIRENGMPFALKAMDGPYIYSASNMKYLCENIKQLENGNGKVHVLRETESI